MTAWGAAWGVMAFLAVICLFLQCYFCFHVFLIEVVSFRAEEHTTDSVNDWIEMMKISNVTWTYFIHYWFLNIGVNLSDSGQATEFVHMTGERRRTSPFQAWFIFRSQANLPGFLYFCILEKALCQVSETEKKEANSDPAQVEEDDGKKLLSICHVFAGKTWCLCIRRTNSWEAKDLRRELLFVPFDSCRHAFRICRSAYILG